MNAPKAFASLSGGLLARKGSAKPAMRRQGFGQVGPGGLDDLGWNDMGQEDPEAAAESKDNIEAINRAVATGLTPSEPVVHDQQAEIARNFTSDDAAEDEDGSYDGADMDDDTAELWDPEAEEEPNPFNERRAEAKADAFNAPAPESGEEDETPHEPEADEAEAPVEVEDEDAEQVTSRETVFDEPRVSQSIFGARAETAESNDEADSEAIDEGDEPQLMRTVADLAPITPDQKGSAWDDEDEGEDTAIPEEDENAGEPVSDDIDIENDDGQDDFGEEEAATDHEAAGEDFDPAEHNRFAAFITRPSQEPAPAEVEMDELAGEDDEFVLEQDMALDDNSDAAEIDANDDSFASRRITSHEVAQAKAGAKEKAAFTLRLDRERHLKLRLACALAGQSAQKMVTEALDRLLGDMEELDELVKQAGVEPKD